MIDYKDCKKWKGITVIDDDSKHEIDAEFLCKWSNDEKNIDRIIDELKGEKYVTSTMLWECVNKLIIRDITKGKISKYYND